MSFLIKMRANSPFSIVVAAVLLFVELHHGIESKVRIDPRNNDVDASLSPVEENASRVSSGVDLIDSIRQIPFVRPKGPHFTVDSPTNVNAAVGSPAHIPCHVRNLGSKSVSWIRHRDLHVLTVGSFTFTNDNRFSAHRDASTGDWVLVLRHPEPTDSGFYECSISTKPVTAHTIKLSVVVPKAELLGKNKNVYLDQGSTLNLTCVVKFSPTPPEYILWYHKELLVDYRQKGRSIGVTTVHEGDITHSSLLIRNATLEDSGKYSCKPSNANISSALVHVLKSETPAAMQTTTTNAANIILWPIELVFLFCLTFVPTLILTDVIPISMVNWAGNFNR